MVTEDMKLFVSDAETMREYFLAGGRMKGTNEIIAFHINKYQNDLYKFVKFVSDNKHEIYWVGFNSLSFDAQVIEYIVREYQEWTNLSNLEICAKICQFAQDRIEDQKYEIKPPYYESSLHTVNIDLLKVHHFDNRANMCSLKWLEFMMDMPNVEEMPVHFLKTGLTEEEIEQVYNYWVNDIDATERFLQITLGDTKELGSEMLTELFEDKNMIQDRLDTIEEFGFPVSCLSWSNVKIGDRINLNGYCKLEGITESQVYEKKRKRKATKGFTYGQCIPSYVTFKTPEFQVFFERMKKVRVNLATKDKFPFQYNKTKYVIAKGGLHSIDKRRIIEPLDSELLRDADIGSQYPNAIVKRKLYPSHLGPNWLVNYNGQIITRLANKKKGTDKTLEERLQNKFKGLGEMGKLALNGGG